MFLAILWTLAVIKAECSYMGMIVILWLYKHMAIMVHLPMLTVFITGFTYMTVQWTRRDEIVEMLTAWVKLDDILTSTPGRADYDIRSFRNMILMVYIVVTSWIGFGGSLVSN